MDMTDAVLIPEGWFWMGSESRYPWESPRHRVWVDAFLIARTAVTRSEYAKFLTATNHPEPAGWTDPVFSSPEQPVVGVNWFDALSYCEWMSKSHAESYRLPTEAEWEKACRGGLEDAEFAWGDTPPSEMEFFAADWRSPGPAATGPVNGYGLLGIGYNVHEWCSDWYASDYYLHSPERNPRGPEEGTRRISRGGSWRHQIKGSRAAHRSSLPPHYRYTDYGFRTVIVPAFGTTHLAR